MKNTIRLKISLAFLAIVFGCLGFYLFAYRHVPPGDIFIYLGRILLVFLIPIIVLFVYFLLVHFLGKRRN